MWIELYHFIEFWCVIKTIARSGEILLKGYEILRLLYKLTNMQSLQCAAICNDLGERGQYLLWLKMKIAKWI